MTPAVKSITRFALETHTGPYESWPMRTRVIVDGALHPTLAVQGYVLKQQYETPFGYVLVTDYDCPFEEAITVTLVAPGLNAVLDSATLGAPYCTFWLKDIAWIDAQHFHLTCDNADHYWLVTLRARHVPLLAPAVSIVRRRSADVPVRS